MSSQSCNNRRHSPSTERNRSAILDVLRGVMPQSGTILEIASGTGEHAAWLTPQLPEMTWQPSDLDTDNFASIEAWAEDARVLKPIRLDVTENDWGEGAVADRLVAIVCINMIHISPWTACEGLIEGASRLLPEGGVLYLYGPYRRNGRHTAQSNADFDFSLRQRNPEWGVRDLETVVAYADINGLILDRVVDMPANNLSVIFRRRAPAQ